jgi:hypothetical protein
MAANPWPSARREYPSRKAAIEGQNQFVCQAATPSDSTTPGGCERHIGLPVGSKSYLQIADFSAAFPRLR